MAVVRHGFRRFPLLFFAALNEFLDDFVESQLLYNDEITLAIVEKLSGIMERHAAVRIREYAELIAPTYSDIGFRSHFRLSRGSAEILVNLLARCPEIPTDHLRGRPPVNVEKQLLITLWVFGNPEVFRSVSDRFNVTRSCVFRILRRVCKAIVNNLAGQFIVWPKGERVADVMQKFQNDNGLPHCIGAIDGTLVPIKAPREKAAEQYINRKKFHSVQLQCVFDASRLFPDVYCAFPGSVHDARILRNSPLCQDAENQELEMFPGGTYIIGDVANL
jgi:hypothetical protein